MDPNPAQRLEKYTSQHPQEVLLVTADIDGREDQILIFRGFSSSLMAPTAFDPDVPVLPPQARILTIDRLQSPYDPQRPQYLERQMAWAEMEARLLSVGL